MNRRGFLTHAAIGLGTMAPATGHLRWPLRTLQTRPALSELALAEYVLGVRARGGTAISGLVREVSTDIRGFLRNRFTLAAAQESFIARLVESDLENIRTGFARGLNGLNEIKVRIPVPNPAGECRMRVEREFRPLQSGVLVENWTIVVENR